MGVTEVVDDRGQLAEWLHPHIIRFNEWLDRGAHAEMEWMISQREARSDPRLLLPAVRSGVALWISHHFPDASPSTPRPYRARVARYAWGRDYHNVLRRVTRRLTKWVQSRDERATCHGSVDTSPVLERAIAERCGVGWIGKSTMLIHPQRGTFGSIAIFLTSARFNQEHQPPKPRCGDCTACIDQCPTGALSAQGLDARRCISYWTIEHRGVIPREIRSLLGEWTFGCDICQDVCPWSVKASRRAPTPKLSLWEPKAERAHPDLTRWLRMSDAALNESLLGSPLRRAHPYGLKRNAIITLTNQLYTAALPLIWDHLRHDDLAVRATAVWSITILSRHLAFSQASIERSSEPLPDEISEQLREVWRSLATTLKDEAEGAVIAEMMWARASLT